MLLKDAGCSSNATRIATLFADDRLVKPRMKIVDCIAARASPSRRSAPPRSAGCIIFSASRARRTRHASSSRSAATAAPRSRVDSEFPDATANAIRSLDEHWNGRGYPDGLAGEEIPLLSRIANIAQTVEVVHAAKGVDAALSIVRQRRRTWFDPALADLVVSWRRDASWWNTVTSPDVIAAVVDSEPFDQVRVVSGGELEGVARAFADIIDAKSPYTYRHSTRVADIARGVAALAGLNPTDQDRLFRAGLLHDIGNLGVSSRILGRAELLDSSDSRFPPPASLFRSTGCKPNDA